MGKDEEWWDPEPTESMENWVDLDSGTTIEFNIQTGSMYISHTAEFWCGSIFYKDFPAFYEKMKEFYEKSKRYEDSFIIKPET